MNCRSENQAGVRNLISNFEAADAKMKEFFIHGKELSDSKVLSLDSALQNCCHSLLSSKLETAEQRRTRIQYLCDRLKRDHKNDILMQKMVDVVLEDMDGIIYSMKDI